MRYVSTRWTREETLTIMRIWNSSMESGMSVDDAISEIMLVMNRSEPSIRYKLYRSGMIVPINPKWTDKETEILQNTINRFGLNGIPASTIDALRKRLPNRTVGSIKAKISHLRGSIRIIPKTREKLEEERGAIPILGENSIYLKAATLIGGEYDRANGILTRNKRPLTGTETMKALMAAKELL